MVANRRRLAVIEPEAPSLICERPMRSVNRGSYLGIIAQVDCARSKAASLQATGASFHRISCLAHALVFDQLFSLTITQRLGSDRWRPWRCSKRTE